MSELFTHFSSIVNPFVEDKDAEIEEEEYHEDHLRDKFGNDVKWASEERVVPQGQCYAEEHVDDTVDYGDFHFIPVKVGNLVVSHLPTRIDTNL